MLFRSMNLEQARNTFKYFLAPTLFQMVSEVRAAWQRQWLQMLHQTAIVLRELHDHKIQHNDIKPSNIMITTPLFTQELIEPKVRLIDLGFGCMVHNNGNEAPKCGHQPPGGTKDYIAPEIDQDAWKPNGKADIYALGKVWEFLCKPALSSQQQNNSLVLWSSAAEVASHKFIRLLDHMTATAPEERPGLDEITRRMANLIAWTYSYPKIVFLKIGRAHV